MNEARRMISARRGGSARMASTEGVEDLERRLGMELSEWLKQIVGESEQDVIKAIEKAGYLWRVVRRDGHALVGTRDYRQDRVNLEIENGIVVRATVR